jgi:GNAT superfamily N-acetyltransferase
MLRGAGSIALSYKIGTGRGWQAAAMSRHIRICRDADLSRVLDIINAAAEAYRDVIPPDRWHEPYMPEAGLRHEIASGVNFWCLEAEGELLGVMALQSVRDVDLIRHAYVRPGAQRRGVGAALIGHLRGTSTRQMLVGTWAAAHWAIAFYRRHGFELVSPARQIELLGIYWNIPQRQIDTSVVLANPPLR